MTVKQRWTTLTICGLALLVAALPAVAQPRGHGPGRGPGFMDGHRFEHLAERLDLSEGQRADLRQAFTARFEEGAEGRRGLFEARQELDAQIHAESFDEAAIREAAGVLAALEAEMAVERARQVQKMHEILTPEQLAQLEEMRGEGRRFGRHRGPRGGGFRGPGGPDGPPSVGE